MSGDRDEQPWLDETGGLTGHDDCGRLVFLCELPRPPRPGGEPAGPAPLGWSTSAALPPEVPAIAPCAVPSPWLVVQSSAEQRGMRDAMDLLRRVIETGRGAQAAELLTKRPSDVP
ncbi:hypothetical protein DLJ53_19330 [Acuticoccus sediminis]|uniref:Uncharacterized protein n=1 Tax=Acuticoccus sediminis TaxID=2184697 RepID=A0A8B2NK81_9HYPH|nr:hypothetical protein [Acuticoccus sediminis]RAH99895.1 hypothetical protein DLJ53_19330 [Acuticoccus sediminis]